MNILFVCTGNTCRSPMAEITAKSLIKDYNFDSAGLFAFEESSISENAGKVLLDHGYDPGNFSSKRVTPELLEKADLILTMTREQKEIIKSFFIEENDKIFILKEYNSKSEDIQDISDPFGGNLVKYQGTFREIEEEIYKLKSLLKEKS